LIELTRSAAARDATTQPVLALRLSGLATTTPIARAGFVQGKTRLENTLNSLEFPRRSALKHLIIAPIILPVLSVYAAKPAIKKNITKRSIRFGYGLKPESNQGKAAVFFAQEVARLSDGLMTLDLQGAGALGNDVKMQDALVAGTQEMMVGATATLVGRVKEMALWDAPFLFQDEKEADRLLDGAVGKRVLDQLPAQGLHGLVYWENGFRNITNAKRPVQKIEDFSDIKLRVMQNPVYIDAFNALGASTVPLSFSELFDALKRGAVDGQENPYTTILSSKFYEVQTYLTISNHVYSPWVVTASAKWWKTLSADEQAILQEAARQSRRFELSVTRGEAIMALAELSKRGMKINKISLAERTRMQARTQGAVNKIIESVGSELWAAAQKELTTYRGG
jgi:TRAP-type transport system periplasmic protein